MMSIKFLVLLVILACVLNLDTVDAAAKKQRRNIKHKKSSQNTKIKGNLKQNPAGKTNQRNGKMNYYNSHFWPTATTYYRPLTSSSPSFLRTPSTTSSSTMFYPMHWGNSYINPSTFMSSNNLRRTDEFSSSSPVSSASSSVMSMPSSSNPLMSMSNPQIPTLYDMSAFTGNSALLEHPFGGSNQNLWSLGETVSSPPTPKPKMNLFNSFNYNDDNGLFGGFLNQFL